LALLRMGGSEIEDHGDHLVIRSPHNPSHWWGNFLLLQAPPAPDRADYWLELFARQFPTAGHVALGFDCVQGGVEDLAAFADRGLSVEAQAVMAASTLREPPHPNLEASYRCLASDADWDQLVELRLACSDAPVDPSSHREFTLAQVATTRRLTEARKGAWFGAFLDSQLVSSMGLFRADSGLARFQNVETQPEVRGRGLAGTLVHRAAGYGFDVLGAHVLIMVADPEYPAIRLYRSLGFTKTQSQLQAERPSAA
jgi:ribosomal protein S18 acetylase RimI-like enzyme